MNASDHDPPTGPVPPVFIGGAGRSGTTLVVDMLGLHGQLSPIYETDFLLMVARPLFAGQDPGRTAAAIRKIMDDWTRPLPRRPHNKRAHERYFHGPHHILFDRAFALARTETLLDGLAGDPVAAFRAFVHDLFAEHCALDGKPRWINKTPVYVSNLPLLQAVFPDLKFIHCLRDGRDVACSVVTRPWGPNTFAEVAPWWSEIVRRGCRFGEEHPEAYREVRYEDLVVRPREVLPGLQAWLGVPDETDAILARYRTSDGEPTLDPSVLARWRREVDPDEVARFEAAAGDLLARCGYPPES